MIYELTGKGDKMWPRSRLHYNSLSTFSLAIDDIDTSYRLWIANGPLEIEALIRLGLIKEI